MIFKPNLKLRNNKFNYSISDYLKLSITPIELKAGLIAMGDFLKLIYLNPFLLIRLFCFKTLKYRKRKYKYTLLTFFSIFAFLFPFQNCKSTKFSTAENLSEGFSLQSSNDPNSQAAEVTSPSNSNETNSSTPAATAPLAPNPEPSSPAGPNPAEIENKLNAACLANADLPIIDSVTTTDANNEIFMNSGLSSGSGNSAAKNIKINFRKVIKDTKLETENNCSRRIMLSVNSQFTSDNTRTAKLNQAIDYLGKNIAATKPATELARNFLNLNNQMASDSNQNLSGTIEVKFDRENNENYLRCIDGTLWIGIQVRQYISGMDMNSGTRSAMSYAKLNLKNVCPNQQKLSEKLTTSQLSQLGSKVSADGNWLAVLASQESLSASVVTVGGVHLYQRTVENLWAHVTTLHPQTTELGIGLTDITLKGDKLFVSSQFAGNSNGRVYYYKLINNNWTFVQTIQSLSMGEILFGASLAFNGTTLFVGSPNYNQVGKVDAFVENSNGHYIFTKSFEPKSNVTSFMAYGNSLAIGGSTQTKLLVGAPQSKLQASLASGRVYVLETSDLDYQKGVIFPKGVLKDLNGQRFGLTLAISPLNQIAIGSPEATINGRLFSGAFTYYNDLNTAITTSEVGMKVIASSSGSTQLGASIAIGASSLFVGAPEMNATPRGISRSGRILKYDLKSLNTTSVQVSEMFPTDHTANSYFGSSLCLVQNSLVVGARLKSNPNRDSGAVYSFDVTP